MLKFCFFVTPFAFVSLTMTANIALIEPLDVQQSHTEHCKMRDLIQDSVFIRQDLEKNFFM